MMKSNGRFHRRSVVAAVALWAITGTSVPGFAQVASEAPPLESRLATLRERLEKRRIESNVPGLALAVVVGDEVVLATGFGLRDVEKELPVTADTLFAVGSTTKAFTAALTAILQKDGLLDFDAKAVDHVPGFALHDPKALKAATIRDLLCHRIGLGRTDMLWMSGDASREQVLAGAALAEPRSPFRKAFHYNNVMFLAAGMAQEKAAQKPWEDLLRERILEPLGMSDTVLTIEAMQASDDFALGYVYEKEQASYRHVPMRRLHNIAPAGCINSSASDMAKWIAMLLAEGKVGATELIDVDLLEEMWEPYIDVGAGVRYGLGWMLHAWQGKRVVEHGGNIDGFAAQVGLLPDERIGYVLLANVSATPLQGESLAIVFESLLPHLVPPDAGAIDARELAKYEGKYHFEPMAADFEAKVDGGVLALDVPGQMLYALRWPDAEGKWVFKAADSIAVRFERVGDEPPHGLVLFQHGLEFFLPRQGATQPPDPGALPAEQLAEYCGSYRFEPTGDAWKVFVKDGRLRLDVPKQLAFTLAPPDADGRFALRESKEMGAYFRRGDDGAIEALEWHQGGKEIRLPRIAAAAAAELPTIDELMSKRAAAGGIAKLAALSPLRLEGRVRFAHQGLDGRVTSWFDGIERSRSEMEFDVFGTMLEGFDDEAAWSRVGDGAVDVDRSRRTEAWRQGQGSMYGDLRDLYAAVEVVGVETRDGEEIAIVEARPEKGSPATLRLRVATGLPVEDRAFMTLSESMSLPVTTKYSDYREVEGLMVPHRIEMDSEAFGRIEMAFESVTPRVAVEADHFTPPS
jgi:CubicO group peptidase (beta-lactamase class C family)